MSCSRSGRVSLPLALVLFGVAACSSDDDTKACDKLDASDTRQATVRTFNEAATALEARIGDVEGKFFRLCNGMNAELGLDTSANSTVTVCGVLNQRVRQAAGSGATIAVELTPNCVMDAAAEADCEASCSNCAVACMALVTASVDCSQAQLTVNVDADAGLEGVLRAHSEEWAELAAITGALKDVVLSFGTTTLDAIGTGNYITNAEQACFVDALGTTVVAVTSMHAAIQSSSCLDPTFVVPPLDH